MLYLQTNPGKVFISGLTSGEVSFVQGLYNLPYATGDILYYDGTQLQRLPIGSDGQTLRVSSGIPDWNSSAGIYAYTHDQDVADSVWAVVHNLDHDAPVITVFDSDGIAIEPEIISVIDNNTIEITFGEDVAGKATVVTNGGTTPGGTGTVTSVAMTVPTGLSVSGTPITTSGTLALTLASGYVIPQQTTLDAKLTNITGYLSAGSNVTVTGTGTFVDPYVINAATPGSTQDLQSVLNEGNSADDVSIDLSNTSDTSTSSLDSYGLNVGDGTGNQTNLDAEGLDIKQGSYSNRVESDAIGTNNYIQTLPARSGTIAHLDQITKSQVGLSNVTDNAQVDLTNNQTVGGVKTFTSFTVTPSSAPTTDYQTANKKYVDDSLSAKANDSDVVKLTGNQTIGGIKTFSSIPVLPASSPSSDNEAARKKYVDDQVATKQNALGYTPENVENKDTDVTLSANSDTKYPSQKAVKAYVDANVGSSIKTFIAAEDLTAGTPVGISNLLDDTVAKASYISRTATVPSLFETGTKMINIATDKVALLYNKTSTSEMWLVIGTLNTSTNTFTFGTPVQITGAVTSIEANWAITKMDNNVVAITYTETSAATTVKLVIATISGTTITLGTPQTAVTAGTTISANGICTISTTKGVLSYYLQSDKTYSIAFTISGTVATFGSIATHDANLRFTPIMSEKLDADKFVVVCYGYAQVGTISGTTITLGTALQIQATIGSGQYAFDLVSVGTNKFIFKAPNGSNTQVIVCTVSGTTITAGTAVTFSNQYPGLIYISDSEIYIRQKLSSTPVLEKFTISGTTITKLGICIGRFSDGGFSKQSLINMGSYWIAISASGTTLTYFVLGMANGFIGFSQSNVSKGSSVGVIINGIDNNQTGLIPGSYYQVSQGALTMINTFTVTDNANELDIVKATSSTSVKF